jgi:hypothetical protein
VTRRFGPVHSQAGPLFEERRRAPGLAGETNHAKREQRTFLFNQGVAFLERGWRRRPIRAPRNNPFAFFEERRPKGRPLLARVPAATQRRCGNPCNLCSRSPARH